ncbi:MAG TPA: hypothetical protein VEC37_18700 [Bacillota bacterium]|nr:hypothetical protein [Bacillota bacterium]
MPFKVTISSSDSKTVLSKCIDNIDLRVDSPNGANARSTDVDNNIEISGQIGTVEPTIDLYKWSLLPAGDKQCYRSVEAKITGAHGSLLRKVTFPHGFIVDYIENYSSYNGNGSFCLIIKQKKDKADCIQVTGDTEVGGEDEDGEE